MRPMLATPAPIPHGPEWCFEVKWDGMRVLAEVGGAAVRLTSRNGNDVTAAFPELQPLAGLGRAAVLDGEVVAFDADGLPSFERLTERIGVGRRSRAGALAAANPVTYVIFDVLELDGEPLLGEEFRHRRALLEGLSLPAGPFVVPAAFDDGDALLRSTKEQGLEGVIAKRWDSRYRPGVRSRSWIKHSHRSTTDAVVIGWRPASGASVASVAVAAVGADGSLTYRGTAGSGISTAMGAALAAALRPRDTPAPADGLAQDAQRLAADGFRWADPDPVVEIAHLGITGAGRFRQPVVARFRPDLRSSDLGAPVPSGTPRKVDEHPVQVAIDGRTLRVTHLDKVLYPLTATTKAQVLEYYTAVAPHLLLLAADRPITRRRWPEGVAGEGFFEKNLPSWAPDWIRRVAMPTSKEPITFPVVGAEDRAALVWLAAHSALELHTPQWRVDPGGRPMAPDRLVIDLDPGPGAGLVQCCRVAVMVRERLADDGLAAHAVLSGSKGLHLYASLHQATRTADEVADYVRGVAQHCGEQAPQLVVVTMAKQARGGRVFVDWSQNRAAKTTLAPWSLRGTAAPQVALPVTWDEVESGDLQQVQIGEALRRLAAGSVPLPW